jgi:hypothetical protein
MHRSTPLLLVLVSVSASVALKDLSLAEPDPHTFEVPQGYTVLDQRTAARAVR